MGSPEKPIDVEMGDMDETNKLNPTDDVEIKGSGKGDAGDRFTGLKKEELLEISSQRKWVVARWVLFIIFWAAWVGMLVGAIIIVIKAPRCKAEPTPPWYQDTTVYQADVRKFAGDLEGMTSHVDYVKSLKSKTLTICHATDPDDLAQVVGKDQTKFDALLKASHNDDADKDLKIVVDLRIDALSTSNDKFKESAAADCTGSTPGDSCDMFLWKANASGADGKWVEHATRKEFYKVTDDDDSLAYVNYADSSAVEYIKAVVKAWIGMNADGFQLRDLSMIADADRMKAVDAVLTAINETQSAAEEKRDIGLFLFASNKADQTALFPEGNNTDAAAVVINTGLTTASSATEIKDAIEDWRSKTEPFIASYADNTMDMEPLAKRLGKAKAAGLTLFTYSLPGVPVMRSGDEALLENDTFIWNSTDSKLQTPHGADLNNTKTISTIANLKVSKHSAKRSLRWDNEDSKFAFLKTNDTNVVAIQRQWDTKPAVVSIYNPSGSDTIVKVTVSQTGEDVKKFTGTLLASSDPSVQDAKCCDAVALKAEHTLLFEVKPE